MRRYSRAAGRGARGRSSSMLCCNLTSFDLYAPGMLQLTHSSGRLDRIAMGLSGLCVVHCVATAALLGLVASAGALGNPLIHEVGLTLAMVIGAYALGRGLMEHGFLMPAGIGSLGLGVMAG